jgi:signal transduction histidine kinase
MQGAETRRTGRLEPTTATQAESRPLDVIIVSFALVVSVVSIAGIVSPAIPLAIVNEDLDRAISGIAAGIAAMAALLQWNRYRESQELPALLQSSALLVLAAANATTLVIGIAGLRDSFGFSLQAPGQAPIYAWFVSRFLAAVLFALAAVAEIRHWRFEPRPAWSIALGMAALAVFAFPFFALFENRLPILYDVAGLGRLLHPEGPSGVAPGTTPTIIGANLLLTVLLVAAARLHKIVAIRSGKQQATLLSLALIIGALSQLQYAIVPPSYFGLVSGGDLLRVAFYGYLVLVFDADTLSTMRDLKTSRVRLEEVRDTDLARVVVAERARLAREVHDGLAQDLWLAKLRVGRLVKAVGDPPTFDKEALALEAAVDDAIAETRLAIVAMNVRPDEPQDLETALGRYVRDLTQRMDIPVTFRAETGIPPLSPQASEEILRAVHEALTNVRRHAEASTAKVVLDAEGQMVRVSIEDDGRGIPPGAAEKSTGYGLTSMRQRVESIGGQLRLESHGWGTRVVVEVPIPSDEGIGSGGVEGREGRPSFGGIQAAGRVEPRLGAATAASAPGRGTSAPVGGVTGSGTGGWLRGGANPRARDRGPVGRANPPVATKPASTSRSPFAVRLGRKPEQVDLGLLTDDPTEESSRA